MQFIHTVVTLAKCLQQVMFGLTQIKLMFQDLFAVAQMHLWIFFVKFGEKSINNVSKFST